MTLRDAIAASPLLFPFAIDTDSDVVQLVELTEQDYAEASFLDQRLELVIRQPIWLRWADLRAVAATLPRHCHFIFHISHCGSTLVSRMLGRLPGCFALREPGILRKLHRTAWCLEECRDRAAHFLALWSRVYRPGQTAVIKTTSYVSEHGSDLMSLVPDCRAVLLFLPLTEFLPAMLDGTLHDVMAESASRIARLQQRLDASFECRSPGEYVAMTWLCEMLSLDAIAARQGGRSLWVNFFDFLQDPGSEVERLSHHFNITTEMNDIARAAMQIELGRYSKKTDVMFNPHNRAKRIEHSRDTHQVEIGRGLDWVRRILQDRACIALDHLTAC